MEGERRKQANPATSQEIVGGKPDENIPKDSQGIYRKLIDLRARLQGRQRSLKADADEEKPEFSLHMADAGTDSFDRDWALSMLSTQQNALNDIEHALTRIRDGTYGICELTGKPIPRDRLEAIPWTRFSLEAEQGLEREGRTDHTQLGEVRSTRASES